MRKIFTFLFAALMSVASMWAQTETLLTTITATGVEQANYSTEGVATVSFSYTAGGSSAYIALWGWWGYGWSATVNAAEGYTITKCVFYDDANRTATDSEAPFVVETTEEDKTPKVNGTPILEDMSKGIKKIEVYGYATPEPAAKYYIVGSMNSWGVDENYEMNPNIYADTEEYFYALDLTTTSEFKVVKVEGENQTWYPTGVGNNYGQNGEITEDAEYTIYFRPNYNGGEDWFYNCIYVSKNEPEPAEKPIVVFEANGNRKEVEVESFPHTFACDFEAEDGELDLIIQELYALPQGGYCDFFNEPVATGNAAVTAGADEDDNHLITISEAFEGTATVSGKYNKYIDLDEEDFTYTLTIYIKGDEPTAVENVQTNQVQAIKFFRDGQLLIEKNGKIYNVQGVEVR